jgi:hypothetical protein
MTAPAGAQTSEDGNYWWDEENSKWELVDQNADPGANAPDGPYHPATHGEFDPNEHGQFHPETHGQFHPETHGQFEPEKHGQFEPEKHGQYHPETHGQFHPETHGPFHPETHGQFEPEKHGPYHPETHGQFHPQTHGDFEPAKHGEFHPQIHGDYHPEIHGEFDQSKHGQFDESMHGQYHPDMHGEAAGAAAGAAGGAGASMDWSNFPTVYAAMTSHSLEAFLAAVDVDPSAVRSESVNHFETAERAHAELQQQVSGTPIEAFEAHHVMQMLGHETAPDGGLQQALTELSGELANGENSAAGESVSQVQQRLADELANVHASMNQ